MAKTENWKKKNMQKTWVCQVYIYVKKKKPTKNY